LESFLNVLHSDSDSDRVFYLVMGPQKLKNGIGS